jgi:UDP-GlcNAc:undecaprenyl-phosphate GlcNAc-1-phosphate transferase
MDVSSAVILAFIGFGLTWSLVPLIPRYLPASGRRQLHHTHGAAISRFGGLALVTAFLALSAIGFFLFQVKAGQAAELSVVMISAAAMFLLGFWDDIRPLGAKRKLVGQILIASAVYLVGTHSEIHLSIGMFRNPFTGTDHSLGGWGFPVTVFWLVSLTNLVNLIDGVDGLAAGICLMVMLLLLVVSWHAGLVFATVCAAGMCGALAGFLRFNFPPASIYLGDGGAYFLGFLIGILSMLHSQKGTVVAALAAPLFVLALPIVDVALAILRRGLKGMPIFRPDQRHLHHRLAQGGRSRTRIVLMFYGCSLIFLLLAFGVFISKGKWLPILFGIACLVLLISARSFSFSRSWFAVGKVLGNSRETRKQTRYALALVEWLKLEVDRGSAQEELWNDLGFICKKLGFSKVRLRTAEGCKLWNHPDRERAEANGYYRRFDLADSLSLEISANADALGNDVFELFTEIAAEAWLDVSQRFDRRISSSAPSGKTKGLSGDERPESSGTGAGTPRPVRT